jgi:hypothetical protein
MAISKDNLLVHGTSGHIGKLLVFKNYSGKTVVTKFPDMSGVVPSENQLKEKSRFGDAVRFAQGIIRDPAKKAAYKTEPGRSVYHTAMTDYLEKNKPSAGG